MTYAKRSGRRREADDHRNTTTVTTRYDPTRGLSKEKAIAHREWMRFSRGYQQYAVLALLRAPSLEYLEQDFEWFRATQGFNSGCKEDAGKQLDELARAYTRRYLELMAEER